MQKIDQIKNFLRNTKIGFPRIINWLLIFMAIYIVFNINMWKDKKVIVWDMISFYAYLPATFIYHDLSFKFVDNVKDPDVVIWYENVPNGNRIVRTSMGLAVMYFPFFYAAHIITPFTSYNPSGYSEPYHLALSLASIFYFSIGLYFLRKLLSKYFSDWIIVVTTLSIVLSTDFYHYVAYDGAMGHCFSFCLITAAIYQITKYYQDPTLKKTILLGLLFGLISLIRPTNILLLIIFLLYGVKSKKDLQNRVLFFVNNYKLTFVLLASFFIVWVPQMIYWKIYTDHWMYYSYPQDQKFFFTDPKFFECLFGFRKGLFIYSPIMLFAFLGFVFLYKKHKEYFYPSILFTFLFMWIMFSWWDWWYGWCFGQREMIEYLGLFSIPIALSLTTFSKLKNKFRIPLFGIYSLCFILGVWNFLKYEGGAIHGYEMTKDAYLTGFWHRNLTPESWKYLSHTDYKKAHYDIYVEESPEEIKKEFNPFEEITIDSTKHKVIKRYFCDVETKTIIDGSKYLNDSFQHPETQSNEKAFKGKFSAKINTENIYGPTIEIPNLHPKYIKVSAWRFGDEDGILVVTSKNAKKLYVTANKSLSKVNGWDKLELTVKIPDDLKDEEGLRVYVFTVGKVDIFFDDIVIDLYN